MDRQSVLLPILCILPIFAEASGCRREPPQSGQAQPIVVTVSLPVVREVRDYVDFTGRTEAVESVEIRARVTGYLEKISFKDGVEVKKGDLLFQIDPRPFKAAYDQAVSQIKVREANAQYRQAELARAKLLLPKAAISQSDFDQAAAAYDEAVAATAAAEANAEAAKLNLDFTMIASPIDGRLSRTQITVGNLVKADETLLTTIVSEDPIYVYFDIDERTMLRITRMLLAAKENALRIGKVPVMMGVADEEGFPHAGYLDFADNVVDPSTGTITTRGVFANPVAASGTRLLRPGMFVRVRLPLGMPHKALLVAERALGTDQGKKYLLVVDDRHTVQYRQVEVGALEDDSLRVITAGLRPEERVIVSGLQLVRPKMEVQMEEVPMPSRPGPVRLAPKPDAAHPGPSPPSP